MEEMLNEAAAWRLIAKLLADPARKVTGLCFEVGALHMDDVIDGATEATMMDRIRTKHDEVQGPDSEADYIWSCGSRPPRIAACNEFAADAEVESLYLDGEK